MMEFSELQSALESENEWDLVVSEHAALTEFAEYLDTTLGNLAAGAYNDLEGSGVRTLLTQFRSRLGSHLASEEQRGVLEQACIAEPRFERRIAQLRSEHGELRARMDALIDADGAIWQLHTSFVSFRRFLHAHEQAENEILRCAYLDDLGGGD